MLVKITAVLKNQDECSAKSYFSGSVAA